MSEAAPAAQPDRLAAVDLGSNSFHMVVARVEGGYPHILDRMREPVRLAMGLTKKGRLAKEAQRRALATLRRFGERVRHLSSESVRAVGTNALRAAHKDEDFLERAQEALGHPIEVVSGQEEARLIHLGVMRSTHPPGDNCLVVDIGGGSTEIILGTPREVRAVNSLPMGCVAYTRRFFPDEGIAAKQMRKARRAARFTVEPHAERYHRKWEHALGSSGTIRAVGAYAASRSWSEGAFDRRTLKQVRHDVIEAGSVAGLIERGVSESRAPVFAAGVAVLSALFDVLDLRAVRPVRGAMREGVLYDLAGRHQDRDIRDDSVAHLQKLYRVDVAQAERVKATARSLFEQVYASWALPGPEGRQLLGWSSALHEVGLSIAHANHQRHGDYLVRHTNMAGFSRSGQALLATLVGQHRGRIRLEAFSALPDPWRVGALRLLALLRLSITLHRNRRPEPLPPIAAQAKNGKLTLSTPADWLAQHPLTEALLLRQGKQLRRAGISLRINPDAV